MPPLDLTKTSTNGQTYKITDEEESKDHNGTIKVDNTYANTAKRYGKVVMDGMKDGVKNALYSPYYGFNYLKNYVHPQKIETKVIDLKQEEQNAYTAQQNNLTSTIENDLNNTNENTPIHNQEEHLPEATTSHLEYASHCVKYICASALLMALGAISHGFINGGSDYHHDHF